MSWIFSSRLIFVILGHVIPKCTQKRMFPSSSGDWVQACGTSEDPWIQLSENILLTATWHEVRATMRELIIPINMRTYNVLDPRVKTFRHPRTVTKYYSKNWDPRIHHCHFLNEAESNVLDPRVKPEDDGEVPQDLDLVNPLLQQFPFLSMPFKAFLRFFRPACRQSGSGDLEEEGFSLGNYLYTLSTQFYTYIYSSGL